MQLSPLSLLLLPVAALAAQATTSLTLRVPATHVLANPNLLPPSTHATLSSFQKPVRSAPLSTANTFVFHNVSAGSYLVDVHSPAQAFVPLRLDVSDGGDDSSSRVRAWETFRGNDWDNKGPAVPVVQGVLDVRALGGKNYFTERAGFSILGILRNPMILLGLVSMVIFLGMPYLVDSMDPEMRAEWEERQKSNPMNSIMNPGAAGQAGGNPMADFDMAAFLAGSSKKEDGNKKKR